MNLKNVKIGRKLSSAFALMIAFMVLIGFYGYWTINQISQSLVDIFATRLPSIDYLVEVDRDLQQLLVAERSMLLLEPASAEFKALLDDYNENLAQSAERWQKYRELTSSPEQLAIIAKFDAARDEWKLASAQQIRQSMNPAQRGSATALSLGPVQQKFETMRDYINELTEINRR